MLDSSRTSSTDEWSSQAFRPQPAKSDERLWYRLHGLAKLAPKTVGHEFSEVAAARIFSMRSGFETDTREGG